MQRETALAGGCRTSSSVRQCLVHGDPAHGVRRRNDAAYQALPLLRLQTRSRRGLQCYAAASALFEAPVPLKISYESILSRGPSTQLPLPTPPNSATFQDVLPYLLRLAIAEKAMYWRVGLAFLCLIASKAAGLMCPLLFKKAIDSFSVGAGIQLSTVLATATQFLLLYGLCDITKQVAKELQAPLFTPVAQAASRRVAYHTFAHVLGLDIRFHLDRRTGRLSRILERGTRSIQMLYRAVIFTFAPTALELLVVCCVLGSRFSPLVGALVLATFAIYSAWSVVMTQVATDARKHVNELDNATSAKAVDALLSYETVTIFNNQALEIAQYNEYLKEYMRACITTDRLAALLNAGQSIILAGGLCAIMVTALWHSGPNVSAGDMVMIQGLLLQLWAPLQFLGWFYRELRSALVDMDEFFSVLRTQSNLVDGTQLLPQVAPVAAAAAAAAASLAAQSSPASSNGNGTTHTSGHGNGVTSGSARAADNQAAAVHERVASGSSASTSGSTSGSDSGLLVELEDVSFGYSQDRQILRGLSLRVEPGKSLALVGPSGSGKSTVLRLLTRLYDVTSGSVRLNGMDVREVQLQSLRESVALVPQETMLFNDSILQNIRYGRPDASHEEVVEAAKLAHLHDAIMRMAKGYATVVGERGLKLSGGEKQRIAIARAFLRQPRLLICDEATSALDSATESQIMNSLNELAVGRTSVFVAHRLSTIKDCDSIAVVREGRLIEQGSHEELMASDVGLYRAMWEMQAKQKAKRAKRQAKLQHPPAGPGLGELPPSEPSDSDLDEGVPQLDMGESEVANQLTALTPAHAGPK